MSVYASWLMLSDFDEDDAPFSYQGSHVVPQPGGQRAGWLELGVVPNHVLARAAGVDDEDEVALAGFKCGFVRLGLGSDDLRPGSKSAGSASAGSASAGSRVTVVLDQEQVRALRDALTQWLDCDVAW